MNQPKRSYIQVTKWTDKKFCEKEKERLESKNLTCFIKQKLGKYALFRKITDADIDDGFVRDLDKFQFEENEEI